MNNTNHAIVCCEGSFNTPNGRTAHGLVRFTERYHIVAVIDSNYKGTDSGSLLDGKSNNIPVVKNLDDALIAAADKGKIVSRLNMVSGLHDFLSENESIRDLAVKYGCTIKDNRKSPDRSKLHFFSGKIEMVDAPKVAVSGTDSAIGKRTTAWLIVHAFR